MSYYPESSELIYFTIITESHNPVESPPFALKNAIYDFAWPCDDASTVATVSGDQSGRVWRLAPDGAAMAPVAALKGHSRSVKVGAVETYTKQSHCTQKQP